MEDYHQRWLLPRLRDALSDTPVILLNGARQTGKSTLAQRMIGARKGRYLTLDDPTALAAAQADPASFVADHHGLLVIDEVQKAPGLFPAIKREVDRQRWPGRFLLTGSADVLVLPSIAESLAGRMQVLGLHPLAQGEIAGTKPSFVASAFANRPAQALLAVSTTGKGRGADAGAAALHARIATGGFPEALARKRRDRRRAWFDAYVTTITQRDIRELSNIADLTALPRLLKLLAVRSGALTNTAELARASAIPQATLHRYLGLLEASFLLQPLPAWHANLGKRLIKAPKTYLLDSGLACAVSGVDESVLATVPHYGGLLETFVLGELRRECNALTEPPRLYHYRSAGGVEVDFVIEDAAGRCVGIEVKATRSLGAKHFAGLKDMQAGLGERFACGVVLYGGEERVRFGEGLWAVPVGG
ncbi:MAG: ATP-binding protein [Proteobacteria bacterium]|nr:ATP-binding protein [Pseudomonadota bacterium]MBS0464886.1 ATP-binding protein [Pseudomonadota bacterium]